MTVRMHGEGVNGRESERESLQGSDQWSGEKVVCSSAHQAVNKQQVIGYQWVFQAKQFTRHKVHLLRLHIESSCNWAAQWGEVPLTLGILNILNLIQSHNAIAQPSAILQQIVHLNNWSSSSAVCKVARCAEEKRQATQGVTDGILETSL